MQQAALKPAGPVKRATAFSGASEAHALAEQHLSDLFENTTVGLLWLDAQGCLLRANRAQFDLFGRAAGQCLGRSLRDLDSNPAAIDELMVQLHEHGLVRDCPLRLKQPDGTVRHALIDGRAFVKRGRLQRAVLFVRDISRRIELQTELLQISEREQQRLGRELHDSLGQHLHAVYYFATLLQQNLSEKSLPQVREAARLSTLLEEALELTRGLAQGLQPVKPVPEGLMVALRELARRGRELYRVNCRFFCPREILVAHNAVATHLYRIAQEAVSNSLKHARPTRVGITLIETSKNIMLKVRDNGRGIRRLTQSAEGMGLQNMQYRANAIGGGLMVKRVPRGGTEVLCSVPVAATYPH